jgi:hypothetical protein
MSEVREAKGRCLCGAVGVLARTMSTSLGACHCAMCRKWTGGPLMTVDCGQAVTFEGEDDISVFDSSPWAQRAFCRKCGSHLYYRLKDANQYVVPAGLFEDTGGLVFEQQIFIDEKPPFYCFGNETRNLTGAEVFALYAPAPDKDAGVPETL